MPEARRRELATLARRYEVAIIEDDTFGQLDGSEPVPIAAHARELGFYIAGVSKTVSHGLRTGYIVAPERALGRVGSAVHSPCWMACPLPAEIAAELIRSCLAMLGRESCWDRVCPCV